MKILISWVGISDFRSVADNRPAENPGPNLRLLRARSFDQIHFFNDLKGVRIGDEDLTTESFRKWLFGNSAVRSHAVRFHHARRELRNDYAKTFRFTKQQLTKLQQQYPTARFAFHLSPGTPAAQVALVLSAKTYFAPEPTLWNTFQPREAKETGVERVRLPVASEKAKN